MNEVATTRQNPVAQFKQNLQRMIDAKELALPSNVSQDAFRNAAIVAVQDNPSILSCTPDSVFKSIRKLAGAGLVPDGREAAIVPFKGQATAMPMVAGLRKIARNSGEIASLWDEVIYQGEMFSVSIEDGERKFRHTMEDGSPLDALTRGGTIAGAYAVAKLKDGTIEFLVMNLAQIEKRRQASASQRGKPKPDGVWRDWFDEMARKTVVRALCNKLPMSAEDVRRIMVEDETNEPRFKDVTPDEPAPRKNLAQRLAEQEILPPEDAPQDDDVPTLNGEVLDLSQAFPGSDDYDAGVKAYQAGEAWQTCPHSDDRAKATDWIGGYMAAKASEGEE